MSGARCGCYGPAIAPRPARLALVSLYLVASTAAGLTRSERRCQDAMAAAGARILARSSALLAACQRAEERGRNPPVDCATDDRTTRARRTVAAKLVRRIPRACAAASSLRPGGDCAAATSAAELAACIAATHTLAAADVLAPLGGRRDLVGGAASRCRLVASARTRGFAAARLRLLQRCKRTPPRDVGPGVSCAASPRMASHLARLVDAARARIVSACRDAPTFVGSIFGPPCDTDAAAGVDCLLGLAASATDAALAAEHRREDFCGDGGAAVERRIDDLLARMTLADKVAQMHGVQIAGPSHTAAAPSLGIPGIAMVDGPRGVGIALGNATAFPVGAARGATWDPALEQRVGDAVGVEARAKGASMILAPTINILRHPRWGRAQETYGEDTFHLARMAVGYVRGAQAHVIANPKHFAANSIEDTRLAVDVVVDERTLREVYLPHFRAAVQEGRAAAVMSAYNQVNGSYCSESSHLLRDVLKGDWGFQGFVESDWLLGVHTTVPAVTAGCDIEMPSAVFFGDKLLAAVAAGDVPAATVDDAVRRILRAQLCMRLDTDPPLVDATQVETQAHRDLARDVEREAIVLLKNDGPALPIDRAQAPTIVVVGPLAATANLGDFGSSTVVPKRTPVTPLAGLQARAGSGVTVTHVPSETLTPQDETTIAAADVAVVVAGFTHDDESEGQIGPGDREMLGLPGAQDQLIAAVAALQPRTVVVLEGSGATLMPWLDAVPAVVMAWYPGQEGGTAIAEVLFGDVNPSGKLPSTFPRAADDLPPFDNTSLAVTYDYYHGYRLLDRNGVAPLFPFGFGRSYTTFAYANLRVSTATMSPFEHVRVAADVTNTGAVAGDEVAQLYVGAQGSRVDRAVNDLRGFTRVHLVPGDTRTVTFDLRAADLAFWNVATGAWEVEPITYALRVGSSSRDLPLAGEVTVVGGP